MRISAWEITPEQEYHELKERLDELDRKFHRNFRVLWTFSCGFWPIELRGGRIAFY